MSGKKSTEVADLLQQGWAARELTNNRLDDAIRKYAESVLKDALSNGKIVSISDNGLTKAGNASYEIIIDAEKTVGTKGENLVKIVISSDGGMLSAYPIK